MLKSLENGSRTVNDQEDNRIFFFRFVLNKKLNLKNKTC